MHCELSDGASSTSGTARRPEKLHRASDLPPQSSPDANPSDWIVDACLAGDESELTRNLDGSWPSSEDSVFGYAAQAKGATASP